MLAAGRLAARHSVAVTLNLGHPIWARHTLLENVDWLLSGLDLNRSQGSKQAGRENGQSTEVQQGACMLQRTTRQQGLGSMASRREHRGVTAQKSSSLCTCVVQWSLLHAREAGWVGAECGMNGTGTASQVSGKHALPLSQYTRITIILCFSVTPTLLVCTCNKVFDATEDRRRK